MLKVSQNHLHISQNKKHLFKGKISRTDIKIYEIYSQNLVVTVLRKILMSDNMIGKIMKHNLHVSQYQQKCCDNNGKLNRIQIF